MLRSQVHRKFDKSVTEYLSACHGATVLFLGTKRDSVYWTERIAAFGQLPIVSSHIESDFGQLNPLEWQTVMAKEMINRYFDIGEALTTSLEKSKYFQVPWGNLPRVCLSLT